MKTRQVVIFSGEQFTVPQGIQRIDTRSTHGWQVRYHGTKMFSDHTPDGSGAAAALVRATKELLKRIAQMLAPVTLQGRPSANKSSGLPSGISGPIVRQRKGAKLRTANLSVLVPRYGLAPRCRTVYIGNENTYTVERYQQALDRAIDIRRQAEEAYAVEATKAKRKAARVMKTLLAEAAARAAAGTPPEGKAAAQPPKQPHPPKASRSPKAAAVNVAAVAEPAKASKTANGAKTGKAVKAVKAVAAPPAPAKAAKPVKVAAVAAPVKSGAARAAAKTVKAARSGSAAKSAA